MGRRGHPHQVRLPGRRAFHFRGLIDKGVVSHFYTPYVHLKTGGDPVETILDLGANIGAETVRFALRHPGARILAVEPHPENFDYLLRNTRGLDGVTCLQAGVGAHDGTLRLFAPENGTNESYFLAEDGPREDGAAPLDLVPVLSLPSLLRDHGLNRVDVVKMDIEGLEAEIFAAPDLSWVDRVKCFIIECNDTQHPRSTRNTVRALTDRGFRTEFYGENFVFFHPDCNWRNQPSVSMKPC